MALRHRERMARTRGSMVAVRLVKGTAHARNPTAQIRSPAPLGGGAALIRICYIQYFLD